MYAAGEAIYPSQSLLNTNAQLITETYFDNYSWATGISGISSTLSPNYSGMLTSYNTSPHYAQQIQKTDAIKGMVTGSKVRVLGTNTFLYTLSLYDDKSRTIQSQSTNISGGIDVITMQYDWSGKILRSYHHHTNPNVSSGLTRMLTKMVYDHAGRLLEIKKSINEGSEKVIVVNEYDDLGQLKTKSLGTNPTTMQPLEKLEHTYNILGWLTGINRGYANPLYTTEASTQANRWFGMQLSYDHGFTSSEYNGNIAGMIWKSTGSDKERAYGFKYDPATLGDFRYKDTHPQYTAKASNSNPSTITDYTYDANGNMVQDFNKDIDKTGGGNGIEYNHLNLPVKIYVKKDGLLERGTIEYVYDASGNKLKKIATDKSLANKTITTTTSYLGAIVYESKTTVPTDVNSLDYVDKLQYISHEEGRIRFIPATGNIPTAFHFDYFIKDHLGNVRMVLTDELKADVYLATLEDATNSFEGQLFNNLNGRVDMPDCFGSNGGKVQRISSARADGKTVVGAGKVLKVMAGDHVDVNVLGWYNKDEVSNNPLLAEPILDLLTQLFLSGIEKTGKFGTGQLQANSLHTGINQLLNNQENYSTQNSAYLNWILLDDEQLGYADGGFSSLMEVHDGSCAAATPLQANNGSGIEIKRNGYLYVFLSNTNMQHPVYFDDLHIEHKRGSLLEETHYYPFGLTMAGISSKAAGSLSNKTKYSSKEEQSNEFSDGSGLEMYDYGARFYDRQIGRWPSVDELAESYSSFSPYNFVLNNPVNGIDPDGRDVIFVNDKNAVKGLGHAAVIIGNPTDGWFYYSMNGTMKEGGSPIGVSHNADIGTPLGNGTDIKQLLIEANTKNTETTPHDYDRYVHIKTTPEEDKAMKIKAAEAASKYWYKVIGASCLNVSQDVFSSLVEGRDIRYRIHAQNLNSNPVPNTWMESLPWMFNFLNTTANSTGNNYFQSPAKPKGGPVIVGPTTGEIIDDDKKQ